MSLTPKTDRLITEMRLHAEVERLKVISPKEFAAPLPKPIIRPCDWGLQGATSNLETQLGTIEAYNRLCAMAGDLRARINAGDIKAPHPSYTSPTPTANGGVNG